MRRRRLRTALLWSAIVLIGALLIVWLVRFRVASAIVDRKLAAAHVDASYRITRIGPFLERMENVRLGAAEAPDLLARRIDVTIGYGLSGPVVRGITADGVRLRARYRNGALSFGSLDRLLPRSGGETGLPSLDLSLRDTELAVTTPAGDIRAAIAGDGNPAQQFTGKARLAALTLNAGGCVVRDLAAVLTVSTDKGRPRSAGPVRVSGVDCQQQKVALGNGVAEILVSSDERLDHVSFDANYAGFAGRVGKLGFAGTSGAISGSRSRSGIGAAAKLRVRSVSIPSWADAVARQAKVAGGTPLGPIVEKAGRTLAGLLRKADAAADLTVDIPAGKPAQIRLHSLTITDARQGRITVEERGGVSWTEAGLRMDADVSSNGGSLPKLAIRIQQPSAGAPLSGFAQLEPYAAGSARLAATAVRFGWEGNSATFATNLTIDGPLNGGFVRGLNVPLRGNITRTGALALDQGCHQLAFRSLHLGAVDFGAAALPICGSPIVRVRDGAVRIDARTGPIRLIGRTSAGTPIVLATAGLRLTQLGFSADLVTAELGEQAQPTQVAIASLSGNFRANGLGGSFAGASGTTANVPLQFAGAQGSWTMAGSHLHLIATLGVSDAAASARFRPLVTDNAMLDLRDGVIAATAGLREPVTRTDVANIDIRHGLSDGSGRALIDVPGITFRLKGVQPEQLTPLTLGVIANVVGTVKGSGRIDWDAQGVTSSGTFGTERIDLAAAFGPVTGIKGQLHFTDLLGMVSAPHQEAAIAEINPGVQVTDGIVHYQLIGGNRVKVEDARWPFAGGNLRLEPSVLDFSAAAERHLTFRIDGLDAAAFIQQLDFPNINATGTFDGLLPMIFDAGGGRIEGGNIAARGPGTLAYVGELSNAQLGTMGKLAFDALKAIRYSSLDISLDGGLDGEMVSRVRFLGIREATPDQSFVTRLIRNLPFRFNIAIRAPFRGLVGSARAYMDPRLLLNQAQVPAAAPKPIQPPASGPVR